MLTEESSKDYHRKRLAICIIPAIENLSVEGYHKSSERHTNIYILLSKN